MFKTNKLRYTSFIALNRGVDKTIFQDSKLLSLMVFISLKVNRNLKDAKDIEGDISKFKLTRLEAIRVTDLTEAEFKTRIKRLESMKIIEKVETTNKYTIYSWLENDYIDLNIQKGQPENIQQVASNDYKNNKNIKYISNIRAYIENNLFSSQTYSVDSYKVVVNEYIKLKKVKLAGDLLISHLRIIEKLFKSNISIKNIISFMQWLDRNKRSDEYSFSHNWNLWTVYNYITNYIAGDYKSWVDSDNLPSYAEVYGLNDKNG